jgi:PhnB protein
MPLNPPENKPRITPYLFYENVSDAIEWLTKAFGFVERLRVPGPDAGIFHAEIRLGDGAVMLGCPGPEYQNPKRLGHVTQNLYVHVDDVDSHFERARNAGAQILEEPKDQTYGDRRYGAVDPEGHCWYFAQHVREVTPKDMKASAESVL